MTHDRSTNRPRPAAAILAAAAAFVAALPLVAAQPASTPAPAPIRPGLPGSPQNELGIERPPALVREGAFVSSARGTLIKSRSGRWFFVFDADSRGRQMPPMVVQPSQYLAAMERLASRIDDEQIRTTGARMLVTGQVLAYLGHNYLLPTAPPLADSGAPELPAPAPTDAAPAAPALMDPAPTEAATPAAEPDIQQIIGELDRAIGSRRITNPARTTDTPPAPADAAPAPTHLENGVPRLRPAGMLTPRRGRIIRSSSGEPLFIIDSGAAGAVPEPPMVLLQCGNLAAIESTAERLGESATFTISGQVHVYKDRNYLLPTMYSVNRVTDQVIPNQ